MTSFTTIKYARKLRRQLSPPEVYLWTRLRKRIENQPAWRRQHPFGKYVFDFYCPNAKLIVEIDGQSHFMGNSPQKDAVRNEFIRESGFELMRIAANDVMNRADEIAFELRRYVFTKAK